MDRELGRRDPEFALAHTAKLGTRPHRRFQDGNDFLTAWKVDGCPAKAGRAAAERLNRIHLGVARRTPNLPGNYDDIDDFVHPLVLLATFGGTRSSRSRRRKRVRAQWCHAVFMFSLVPGRPSEVCSRS